jgi:hypothetical protein
MWLPWCLSFGFTVATIEMPLDRREPSIFFRGRAGPRVEPNATRYFVFTRQKPLVSVDE